MKTACWNCSTRMKGGPSFCPTCGQPTEHASADEKREWEIHRWRSHREAGTGEPAWMRPRRVTPRPGAVGTAPPVRQAASSAGNGLAPRVAPEPTPNGASPANSERQHVGTKFKGRHSFRLPGLRRRPKTEPDRVIDLDPDHEFAFDACVSCGRTDWLIRTGRNEDETYRYWCVRCSRSFKSDVRLAHGRKPFILGGGIVAFLVVLTNLPV